MYCFFPWTTKFQYRTLSWFAVRLESNFLQNALVLVVLALGDLDDMINIFRCNVHHQQGIWCFKVHPYSVSSDQCWRWPLRPKWKFIGLHKTADHALAIQPDLIYRSPSAAILARKAKASVAVSDEVSWLCKILSWRKCLGVQGAGTWRKLLGSRKDKKYHQSWR